MGTFRMNVLAGNRRAYSPLSDRQHGMTAPCIAVIEDEPEIADLLRDIFECEGYDVLTFLRPDLFETEARGMAPDVFLIDMMLPGIDGITFATQLRDEGYSDTPMIALSASRTMCHGALHSRLFRYTIAKPFGLPVLLEAVGRLVREQRRVAG
ncbi:MAG: hypothetical protein NVS2B16_30690 [Chloroflexota bacterium]